MHRLLEINSKYRKYASDLFVDKKTLCIYNVERSVVQLYTTERIVYIVCDPEQLTARSLSINSLKKYRTHDEYAYDYFCVECSDLQKVLSQKYAIMSRQRVKL